MDFAKRIEEMLSFGVLNLSIMHELITEGVLINADEDKIKADLKDESSALDLRLSNEGWQLRSTVKPKNADIVKKLMDNYKISDLNNLDAGQLLEPGNVYLIQLQESLDFRDELILYAQASGKSTIGRLDVLTRLVIDGSPIYDEVNSGYRGPLYIEIIPLSFPIIVKKGDSLNQLRLFRGNPIRSKLNEKELEHMSVSTSIILTENGESKRENIEKLRIDLTLTRCGSKYGCAYEAKRDSSIEPIIISSKEKYDPSKYWNIIEAKNNSIKMEKDHFYILRSKERFFLPKDIAVRCIAYTENLGETRIHYAGFAHPWFARGSDGKKNIKGAPLIFEVRCHSFPVEARDGEDFARIEFYQMASPTEVHTPYDSQELKLSKYFDDWK